MKRINGRIDCPKCCRPALRIWIIRGGLCDRCLVATFPLQEILKNAKVGLHRKLKKIYYRQKQKEKLALVKSQAH